MISASFQKAIDNLKIEDVYLRAFTARCGENFDPKYYSGIDSLAVQLKHFVKQSTVVEVENDGRLLRVFIDVGVRWVDENIEDGEGADSIMALIEAEYVAEYTMEEELEKACIDEFSLKNASFHVWPYWREFLSNHCDRLRLPKVMLPTVQFADNQHVNDPEILQSETSAENNN